ncbi:hypothetical protein SDC9_112898 [bioreactor metagenome]|uniref:Uncharacterized protein n=1 Tax=bioreactor metagenome TaxID=1076179 RepID=A0A645BW28_9ZZZZ
MVADKHMKFCCLQHGVFHDSGILHGPPIVREGNGARRLHGGVVGGLFAGKPYRHGSAGLNFDRCGMGAHIGYDFGAVGGRRRIGHGQYRCDAAGGGCQSSGGNVLFVCLPRLPQVDVHIDKARRCAESRRIDDVGTCRRLCGKAAVFDINVASAHSLGDQHRIFND